MAKHWRNQLSSVYLNHPCAHQLILVKFSYDIGPLSTVPLTLTFVVKVDEIRPNGKTTSRSLHHPQGAFFPPERGNSYDSGSSHYFRFKHKYFDALGPDPEKHLLHVSDLELYSVATVFCQTSTDHLLGVQTDARVYDVSHFGGGWRPLSFYYQITGSSSFASLAYSGNQVKLPAPIPPGWNNLVPQPYRYQNKIDADGRIIQPNTKFGGLIGSLPFLVALAAFSAPQDNLDEVLKNHIRGGRWIPHNYNTGRQSLFLIHHQIYR